MNLSKLLISVIQPLTDSGKQPWETTYERDINILTRVRNAACKDTDSITFDEAATLPTSLTTAGIGLYQTPDQEGRGGLGFTPPWVPGGKNKYSGRSIVVLGGSSIVGQGAIQWARLSGFSPIVTTASLSNEAFLKSLGATHVVGRGAARAEEIKNILPGGATSLVWDAISEEETQKLAIAVTKPNADIILSLPAIPGLDTGGKRHIFSVAGGNGLDEESLLASGRRFRSIWCRVN